LTTIGGDATTVAPSVYWQTALKTFLDTLSSPRTQRAYKRVVEEAMQAMGVDLMADLTPPMLAQYRASLVVRLDPDREDRLSPSTVSLKLAGLRSFLNFCRVTGVTLLSKDVIVFVLESPKAKVQKPYDVLSEPERQKLVDAAQAPSEQALVFLALGCELRVSTCKGGTLQNHRSGSKALACAGVELEKTQGFELSSPKLHIRSSFVLSWLAVGRESGRRCPVSSCDRRSAACPMLVMAHSGRDSRGFSASCLSRAELFNVLFDQNRGG
jgi:hypothetical protein